MRAMARVAGFFVVVTVLAVLPNWVRAEGVPDNDRARDVELLLGAELWRVGGPRPEVLVAFFGRAVAAGDPMTVAAVASVFQPLFDHRMLDPNLCARFLPQLEEMSTGPNRSHVENLARPFREEIKLYNLSEAEREDLFGSVLRSGRDNHEYGLSWATAAVRALDEHMERLTALVESQIAVGQATDSVGGARIRAIREVWLPLALARQSADWPGEYMKLIAQRVEEQAVDRDYDCCTLRNRLMREALLELVYGGKRETLTGLKALWRSLKEPEYEASAKRAEWARDAERRVVDPDYPRRGWVALDLAQAIRALGEPSFQAKNLHLEENRQRTERLFVEKGWLTPRAEVQ
jgi:hypothetical protein